MNINNYSRLLLKHNSCPIYGTNNPWKQVLFQVVDPEKYRWIHAYHQQLRFRSFEPSNHPLVNKGIGYWKNNTTLCIGYILKEKPNIYRPIFCHKREKQIYNFLPNIHIAVKNREKYLIFVEIMKIKKFPRVIINEIIKFI